MSFVAMVYQYGRRDVFEQLPDDFLAAMQDVPRSLAAFLGHIAEPLRTHRIAQAQVLIVHAAADRERARATGQLLVAVRGRARRPRRRHGGIPGGARLGGVADALERADPARVTWPTFRDPCSLHRPAGSRRSRAVRAQRLPGRGVDAAAGRGTGGLLRAAGLPAVLGDHEARRHRGGGVATGGASRTRTGSSWARSARRRSRRR